MPMTHLRDVKQEELPSEVGAWKLEENLEDLVDYVAPVNDWLVYAEARSHKFEGKPVWFMGGYMRNTETGQETDFTLSGIYVYPKRASTDKDWLLGNMLSFVKEFQDEEDVKDLIEDVMRLRKNKSKEKLNEEVT